MIKDSFGELSISELMKLKEFVEGFLNARSFGALSEDAKYFVKHRLGEIEKELHDRAFGGNPSKMFPKKDS